MTPATNASTPPLPAARPVVWTVEDDVDFRGALAEVLAPAAEVARAFGSVEEALAWIGVADRTVGLARPDVLLLDVNLPGMSGLDGLAALKARLPLARVVMLTIRDDAETVYAALGAGASGYLLKSADPDELVAGVEAAYAGAMLIPPTVARLVLARFERVGPTQDYGLTGREREVLGWMVEGLIQKEIAAKLNVSDSTVNTHVQHIYEKLQVHNAAAAVAKAVREELLKRG
jgi:DNA-binding NarL/FixJ family response regulator